MDSDAELDAHVVRDARIVLDHAGLHLNGATHRVDHTAELDEAAVARALDGAPVMRGDGRVDQIVAHRPEPRERSLLVRPGEPAVADDIGDEDRSDLPRFHHWAASGFVEAIMNGASALLWRASAGEEARERKPAYSGRQGSAAGDAGPSGDPGPDAAVDIGAPLARN